MSKIGRNDRCHCGSGKKYKKCHLDRDQSRARTEKTLKSLPEWVEFHTVGLNEAARQHAVNLPALADAAKTVFGDTVPDDLFSDALLAQHALYDLNGGEGVAINRVDLSDDESSERKRALCGVLAGTHLSVYEVISAKHGKGIRLLDRLTGGERWLGEPALAEVLEPMETICGRVAHIDKHNLLLAGWEKISFHHRKQIIGGLDERIAAAGFEADDRKARVIWAKAKGAQIIAACRERAAS